MTHAQEHNDEHALHDFISEDEIARSVSSPMFPPIALSSESESALTPDALAETDNASLDEYAPDTLQDEVMSRSEKTHESVSVFEPTISAKIVQSIAAQQPNQLNTRKYARKTRSCAKEETDVVVSEIKDEPEDVPEIDETEEAVCAKAPIVVDEADEMDALNDKDSFDDTSSEPEDKGEAFDDISGELSGDNNDSGETFDDNTEDLEEAEDESENNDSDDVDSEDDVDIDIDEDDDELDPDDEGVNRLAIMESGEARVSFKRPTSMDIASKVQNARTPQSSGNIMIAIGGGALIVIILVAILVISVVSTPVSTGEDVVDEPAIEQEEDLRYEQLQPVTMAYELTTSDPALAGDNPVFQFRYPTGWELDMSKSEDGMISLVNESDRAIAVTFYAYPTSTTGPRTIVSSIDKIRDASFTPSVSRGIDLSSLGSFVVAGVALQSGTAKDFMDGTVSTSEAICLLSAHALDDPQNIIVKGGVPYFSYGGDIAFCCGVPEGGMTNQQASEAVAIIASFVQVL